MGTKLDLFKICGELKNFDLALPENLLVPSLEGSSCSAFLKKKNLKQADPETFFFQAKSITS
jgi:hypothetical protein